MSEFSVHRTAVTHPALKYCLVLDGTRIAGGKPDYRGNNHLISWHTRETYGPVDDLMAENAKLREELEQWHKLTAGIELPEYPMVEFQPKDLERENAKLRKRNKYNGSVMEACTREILDHIGVPYIVGPAGVAQALMEATAMLVHKRYDFDPPSFYKEDE